MATELRTPDYAAELAPDVRALLGGLRRRIRGYVWLEGLAACVAVLVVAFWGALAVDWLFEPSAAVRQGLVALGVLVAAGTLYRLSLRRAFVALGDRSMALLLERRYQQYEDSLLTAVELAGRVADFDDYGREMLAHTCDEARSRSSQVDVGSVLNRVPLVQAVGIAGVLLTSLAAFAVAAPGALRLGAARLAALTNEPWPRWTHLRIDGFDNPDRQRVIARGTDVELFVQADATPPAVVPQVVQIRYRTEDGRTKRENMTREGNAVAGEGAYQDFRYSFPGVLSDVRFDVVGGDARLRDLKIRVVDSPHISMMLHCEYPAYMNRLASDLPGTGNVPLPLGTKVIVQAQATKELVRAQVDYMLDAKTPATRELPLAGGRDFQFVLERLDADKTILFTLLDTDGIQSRQPIPLVLTAVPDEPPQLAVRLEGIGSAVTPLARLPLAGDVSDDYGVAKVWVEYVVDEQAAREQPLAVAAGGRSSIEVHEAIDLEGLGLKPGQKLLLGTKAADNHKLPGAEGPNVAAGERYLLDVVTPEQLRAMLEARELNLRERFEAIISEMTETRDLLARLETGAEPAPAEGAAADDEGVVVERLASRRQLRVERALQNSQKNADETRGVALSFDGIRAELVNNRVDTEELRIRLKDQIADPLRRIAGDMFSELEGRLAELGKRVTASTESDEAIASARQGALDQADAILVEMRQVRDKMLELESFNEAIELLREIIAAQQEVGERTRQQRREQVRKLLEDEE